MDDMVFSLNDALVKRLADVIGEVTTAMTSDADSTSRVATCPSHSARVALSELTGARLRSGSSGKGYSGGAAPSVMSYCPPTKMQVLDPLATTVEQHKSP
jgi:hypothetical protein